jgi:hypothetical protein
MTALTKAAKQSVDTIDAMLARIDRQKRAEANTEPGGYAGKSTHPSTDIDDRTEGASEGARSSENTADVKEDQGSSSVDSTSPGTPGGQDSVQMNIGTNQSATGEDPAVETESAKPGKEDPGSSHPARTDNDSLDGHKYASPSKVLNLIKAAQSRGTSLIAKIAVEADGPLKQAAAKLQQKKAGDPPPHGTEGAGKLPPTTVDESDTSAESPPPGKGSKKEGASQAGAAVANAVAGNPQVKAAQDQVVVQSIAETIDVAYRMAEKTATYLDSYLATKKAMDEEGGEGEEEPSEGKSEGSPPEGSSGESEGGGDSSSSGSAMGGAPAEGSMSGGGGGGEEQALLDLLAGGEGMGADQAAGGMMGGGAPPMGGGGGAPPMGDPMAGGGMPPGAGGGMPPGAGAPPGDPMAGGGMPPPGGAGGIDPAMLAEALAQAGIPPEAFQALLAGKAAAAIKRAGFNPRQGAWKPKTAEQARQYQQVLNYVKEVAS